MIKAIIIDDESKCRSVLEKQLEWSCPDVNIIGSYSNPVEALVKVKDLKPDLIFLDIEMPELNGFQFLQQLGEITFEVIFTTAYDEYALRAFQIHAAAYLLKPIAEEDLIGAIKRLKERGVVHLNQETILQLFDSMKNKGLSRKVAIPTMAGLEFINRDHIIRCESEGNYTKIYRLNQPVLLISKTLKLVEELLDDPHLFVRTHAAHLVNLNYVAKYLKGAGGQLIMEDGAVIPVSKSKKSTILNAL